MAEWIDLLDPSLDEIRRHAPQGIDHVVVADLVRPASADPVVRPALQGYGDYVFGRLLAAVLVPEEDRVFYQEVDLVLTHDRIVTVRKTPEGEAPYDVTGVKKVCEAKGDLQSGMIAFHLLDDVAERYIELLEAFDDEIDELEEHIDEWSNDRTRRRLSDLRHDLLHIRRTLRERPERGDEDADRDCVTAPTPDVHRRPVRPELPAPLPGDPLAAGVPVVMGADRGDDVPPALVLPAEALDLGHETFRLRADRRPGYADLVPYFICPNCKQRSLDHDGLQELDNVPVACERCGFGFLFELMDDYYPAPNAGFVVCDANARILASGRGVFELTGYSEGELLGMNVVDRLGLSGFDPDRNPAKLALEWGVRRLGERLRLRTRAGHEKEVTADFFPAYDEDGGLLVALNPR